MGKQNGKTPRWWEGIDQQKAREEPPTAPEWIEQTDGQLRKPEWFKWVPDEWQYYCMLCGHNGTPADEKHCASEKHIARLIWKPKEIEGCDTSTIRRVVKNEAFNFWDPHNLTTDPSGQGPQQSLMWHPAAGSSSGGSGAWPRVGTTPAGTPAGSAGGTPEPAQRILPPPGLEGPMEDRTIRAIVSLRDAIVDLTTVVRELKEIIQD